MRSAGPESACFEFRLNFAFANRSERPIVDLKRNIAPEQKERRGRSRLATSPPVLRFKDYQKNVAPTVPALSKSL